MLVLCFKNVCYIALSVLIVAAGDEMMLITTGLAPEAILVYELWPFHLQVSMGSFVYRLHHVSDLVVIAIVVMPLLLMSIIMLTTALTIPTTMTI